ncbi:hypothetical protein C8A05DRAFT_16078, partial [Staphylotrichum tortipilum]
DQFTASRCFTRGWTLQELLAPAELIFHDRHWQRLGSRAKTWMTKSCEDGNLKSKRPTLRVKGSQLRC